MTTWFKPANRSNTAADGISVEEQTGAANSLLNAYRALGELRRAHPALRSRAFQVIDKPAGCPACLAMWRWVDGELALVAFNMSDQPAELLIPAERPIAATATPVSPSGFTGGPSHTLPAWGWLLVTWPAR
jgi:glycosidase